VSSDWTSVAGSVTLTPGAEYFLSADNSGMMTTVPSMSDGNSVVPVGVAKTETTFDIDIELPILL
jgi:hypothetical protein